MVARMRPFNLEGMFAPRAEARATAVRASEGLARTVNDGLSGIGDALIVRRREDESKRRFGIEKGLEERRLAISESDAALRSEEMDLQKEERLEKAAAADGLLDSVEQMSQKFTVMSQLGVSPSDQDWSQFNAHVTALGGEQAVHGAFGIRAENGGAVPTQDRDNIFDLDSRLRRNEERRVQVDGLMKQANALASSRSGKTAARARLANAGLLNAKAALDAESTSLQRRYALAGKQQSKAEKDAADAAYEDKQRQMRDALLPHLEQAAQRFPETVDGARLMNDAQRFLKSRGDPDADFNSIVSGWRADRSTDAEFQTAQAIQKANAADAGREATGVRTGSEQQAYSDEARERTNTRLEGSQRSQEEARERSETFRAFNEVQQALGRGDAADRRAEEAARRKEIDEAEKERRYTANAAQRVADLKKVPGSALQRAYHTGKLSEQQKREIEAAYGGIPPPLSPASPAAGPQTAPRSAQRTAPAAAPAQAPASAPAPAQAQSRPFQVPSVQGTGKIAVARAWAMVPPDQRSKENLDAIYARYCPT